MRDRCEFPGWLERRGYSRRVKRLLGRRRRPAPRRALPDGERPAGGNVVPFPQRTRPAA